MLIKTLYYYVTLHSEFRVVMSVTISTRFGSSLPPVVCRSANICLHCLCIMVSNTICDCFCFVLFCSSCVPCVASFNGLSFFDCPFDVLQRLFISLDL